MIIKHFQPGNISKECVARFLLKMHNQYWVDKKIGLDIDQYSAKLAAQSVAFVCLDEANNISAALFGYANDLTERIGFVSYIGKVKEVPRGVATQLHARFVEYARNVGMKWIRLEVRNSNLNAISFYKKLGYELLKNGEVKSTFELPIDGRVS